MKRCKSDELQQQQGEEDGAGLEDAACHLPGADIRPGEAAGANSAGGPTSDAGAAAAPNPGPRSKPPDLKKIQQLSEGSMFGHGLKHLFHSRRRSREREHPSSQDPQQQQQGMSDHESPDEKERSPEMHRVSYAMSLHDLPARPTAFNRVLQQIRLPRPSPSPGAWSNSCSLNGKAGGSAHRVNQSSGQPVWRTGHCIRSQPPSARTLESLGPHCRSFSSSSSPDPGEPPVGPPSLGFLMDCSFLCLPPQVDKGDFLALNLAGGPGHGQGDADGPISLDVPDGAPDPQRTKAAIEHLHQKILKITEQIKIEQEARDDNVAEYLKLANNADKQQASRIKQVFEKKNQKSAQTIAQLHKKLEHYRRRLREIEQNGPSRQPKDVLRDMQQGLKDVGANVRAGISGFGGGVVGGVKGSLSGLSQATHSAVVSKPREFASLIRNKFGSADNIAHLKDPLDDGPPEEAARALSGSATLVSSPKYASDDECSSASASSAGAGSNSGAGPAAAAPGSPKSGQLYGAPGNVDAVLEELREIKEGQSHLEDSMEDLKAQLQRDYTYMTQCLQEERYRYERLEEQLNDLTELHQNEMTNLKQELASMEEKVAYQSYERARDIQEAVESCLTRVTKLELQQQQQQVVQLEGVENANARALLGKFINVILALMAVLLVFVSTVASFITPLMKTRLRVSSTALLALVLLLLWKHWDSLTYLLEHVLLPS
ncbi:Transmembrane and coiled-coil domains protein 2 [Bos mutus]|uniref:Transmembrane and coiled-coil domains protein 2 n=1 Tax=Bos mutus TaxID=72004 RepID=L8HS30_9CETA|nr:Transmembrane and coiled-coil domains protein 2 [Bos mutus]